MIFIGDRPIRVLEGVLMPGRTMGSCVVPNPIFPPKTILSPSHRLQVVFIVAPALVAKMVKI